MLQAFEIVACALCAHGLHCGKSCNSITDCTLLTLHVYRLQLPKESYLSVEKILKCR